MAFKFGECLREHRVLIQSDGFYEWKAVGKKKQACHFSRSDGMPFAFAGLWDVWQDDNVKVIGACFLTTAPNDVVKPYHDRMPVILPHEHYAEWLDPDTDVDQLLTLLKPYPTELMRAREVGPAVNSSKKDSPDCIKPIISEQQLPLFN